MGHQRYYRHFTLLIAVPVRSWQAFMYILARCTQKSDVRSYNNAKGSGTVFSFTVTDESCDLKCTAFKEDVEK